MLSTRVLSAAVLVPLIFVVIWFGGNVFFGTVIVLSALGLYEYFHAVNNGQIKPMAAIGIISGLLLLIMMYFDKGLNYFVPFITLMIIILLTIPVFIRKYNFMGAGATVIGVLYVPLFFGYLYLIRSIPDNGFYLIWFVFIASWFCDTFAYFSGRLFGKTKLCPEVSPKKTVEGAVGGVLGSVIGCIIYGVILSNNNIINIPTFHLFMIGFFGSIISQFGDLAASSIKRNVGVKDYGKIMPGHGGVLDRFDSILFAAPLIYYYIVYILI